MGQLKKGHTHISLFSTNAAAAPKHHTSSMLPKVLFFVSTTSGNVIALKEHRCRGRFSRGAPPVQQVKNYRRNPQQRHREQHNRLGFDTVSPQKKIQRQHKNRYECQTDNMPDCKKSPSHRNAPFYLYLFLPYFTTFCQSF